MTDDVHRVHVALGERSYDIEVGAGRLARLGPTLASLGKATHAIVITDANVQEPYALPAAESLSAAEIDVDIISVEPGEESKSVETAAGLWNGMLELGADRQTVVVAVGGGVVGDLAGFVAATFLRGLRFFQVPTTLLAQVDSSVGGKVGVNLPEGKNMVGAFWQPIGVLIDPTVLGSLPDREYRAGLAEVVKYGVILDAEFFGFLEARADQLNARDPSCLAEVITRCCRLKADVVEADEFERSGHRAILNYGHTFAHAFETLSGYGALLHGEAVAMGMTCAARLAERMRRVDSAFVARQTALLERLGLPVNPPKCDAEAALKVMARDKKVSHGALRFVLPSRLGAVELVGGVDPREVAAVLG